MSKPVISDDPMYQLLREGEIKAFNEKKAAGGAVNMSGFDFRNMNLQGMDASGLDLSNCYFRKTDLRGLDLSQANLLGASIHDARISGVLFPAQLTAEEITLSLDHGVRLRYR